MYPSLVSEPLFDEPFPLRGVVVIVGAYQRPVASPQPLVMAVLGRHGAIRTLARRGVSQMVERATRHYPHALQLTSPEALLHQVSAVCLIPSASGSLPGELDALMTQAAETGLPLWTAGPAPLGRSWQPLTLLGIPGFTHTPDTRQGSLF